MARLLYVSQGYSTHDRRFLERLAQTSHEVWFLPCTTDPIILESRPTPEGVHRLPPLVNHRWARAPWSWVSCWMRFRRHLQALRPDLVQAGPVQTGGFLAAFSGCRPLLVMSWGSDMLVTPGRAPWLGWVTRYVLSHAQMAIADCRAVRDRILELSRLTEDQVVVFPFGVDLSQFRPMPSVLFLRERLGWNGHPVVISTRSFEVSHGVLVFVEAAIEVLRKDPDVRFLMLGDGYLRPKVEALIARNRLAEKIHLAGQISHERMAEYFNEADLYVSAAYSDGSSISLLEAMACGLPVIASDGYGNRECVTHGINGWLVSSGNVRAIAEAVQEGLSSSARMHAMRERNLARVREHADWEKNFSKLLYAYETILGATPVSGGVVHA